MARPRSGSRYNRSRSKRIASERRSNSCRPTGTPRVLHAHMQRAHKMALKRVAEKETTKKGRRRQTGRPRKARDRDEQVLRQLRHSY